MTGILGLGWWGWTQGNPLSFYFACQPCCLCWQKSKLGGGNSNIFGIFTPIWGNDPIWRSYFSNRVVQPPARNTSNRVPTKIIATRCYNKTRTMNSNVSEVVSFAIRRFFSRETKYIWHDIHNIEYIQHLPDDFHERFTLPMKSIWIPNLFGVFSRIWNFSQTKGPKKFMFPHPVETNPRRRWWVEISFVPISWPDVVWRFGGGSFHPWIAGSRARIKGDPGP